MTLQGIVETCKPTLEETRHATRNGFELIMIAPDEHLIVTRVLLGLFESGFFPAASYLLFTWYCRYEVQTRMGNLLYFRLVRLRNLEKEKS